MPPYLEYCREDESLVFEGKRLVLTKIIKLQKEEKEQEHLTLLLIQCVVRVIPALAKSQVNGLEVVPSN